ncbi:serine hydrolase domain-containing protein [Gryllotalpicola protaetiae]|uniref:Class A beta-lactamase-related serine hydrolase n=1 Tax=Gryllotalpicola protaetiae TaxID=2419771 RepID=A0A387BXE3_9MICO|nr:serine hydrolase domain-containing protein [Gryllotalpicola protaetiae]AYG03021.1 class A beta-lactamase-related serine hydrolase [Gryllotalpicola protaetiae]
MNLDETLLSETIDALFAPRIANGVTPGSVVAVFDERGELALTRGFGLDRLTEDGATPDADTAFRIASCTKSFTASAALLLRDRGALVLDQAITDFVPEFCWADGSAEVPTLRQLLSMSGGLSTDDPWADRQEGLSDEEFHAVLAAGTPRDSVPGTVFRYSNLGYALVGQAIALAAGVPFIDFVTAELLEPLGLTATGFRADGRPGRTAVGHRRDVAGTWHPLPYSTHGAFSPIGGIVTTARDLACWGAWHASALTDAPQPGPLGAASRRELQQVHRTIATTRPGVEEFGYGFGLMVEKGARLGHTVSHSGGYPGFSAHLRWNAPGRFGVVAFENGTYAGVSEPTTALVDALIEHGQRAAPPTPWPETIALALAADRLITAWATDAAADALEEEVLSPNVVQDQPIAERREVVAALGVTPTDEEPALEASASPASVSWVRAAAGGRVRVRLSLAPVTPARIQTLAISHEKPAE